MANLKNGAIREMVIDKCLSDRNKKYSTKDIMDACNVALVSEGYAEVTSLNTIRSDMRIINERWSAYGGAVIEESHGRNKYYHYEDPNFSIYNAGLTNDEITTLNQALNVLSRFKGQVKYGWIEEFYARIKSEFMTSHGDSSIIEFQDTVNGNCSKGSIHLSSVFDAISERSAIDINYLCQAETTKTIHPYYLKEDNNKWYLYGLDEQSREIVTIFLDDVISVKKADIEYIPNIAFNFNEYFTKILGKELTSGSEPQIIKLWVSNDLCSYIKENPLHESQTILDYWNDGSMIVQINVIPNDELIRKIFSFAEKLVVLEPYSIRKKIQDHVWFTGETYDKIK